MSLNFDDILQQLIIARIPSPRLETRLLMAHATGKKLQELVSKRCEHYPLDKLLGFREFYKNRFIVSEAVLSPRPDTEVLVEAAINLIKQNRLKQILDLGTGSGCILLSILDDCPGTEGVAVDKSEQALKVAGKNAEALSLQNRVKFHQASWFESDLLSKIGEGFDMIVSNPPYIPSADIEELDVEVRTHDPLAALDGGADGFEHYQKIAEISPLLLKSGGYILLEAGINQAQKISTTFAEQGLHPIDILPDLSGIERCVILKK